MTRPEARDGVAFHAARRAAWASAHPLPGEEVPLGDAIGRMSAAGVSALIDVPHYPSSAMDGWAVAGGGPWRLVTDDLGLLESGTAVAIVTGGIVPDGAEAILRSEHGVADGERLTATVAPAAGRHIRPAGEESRRGGTVIASGIRLSPAHIAVAAGCGHDSIVVAGEPRVAFVFTGSEVVTSGLPTAGRVRDSFDPMLPAMLEGLGAQTVGRVRIPDSPRLLRDALSTDADLVVTTGGTGDSPADHLRPVLAEIGAELLVDGLATRPGAPTLLARLPGGGLVLGLPGNPLAAVVGLLTLAPSLIAGMRGLALAELDRVVMARDLAGIRHRTQLIPYRLSGGRAVAAERVGSGMLRGLADAAGVLVVPEDGLRAGDDVEMLPLPW